MPPQTNPDDRQPTYLEPRVAKLEVGMERLTDDVRNLATVVREQGSQMEQQIQQLIVAVTQASGPRKTDWSTIIAALMLVMAIGSAVFWPLNKTSQDNKDAIAEIRHEIIDHNKLQLHPVGEARINNMESRYNELVTMHTQNLEALDKKLQKETELITTEIKNQVSTISGKYDREITDLGTRVISRLNEYDQDEHDRIQKELDELRMWRLKSMGLCNQNAPSTK